MGMIKGICLMNLWHLQVFREVMLSGSVTKAAKNLGRTQPAISAAIANLEREIGYELFERKNSRLQAVPEAQFLLGESEEILRRMASLERSMRQGGGRDTEQIRVACMPIISEFFMPRFIAKFAKQYPNASFLMQSTPSATLYEQLSIEQFDVGLAELGWDSDLVDADPIELDCVCALPAYDPLAKNEFVTPQDLDGKPCATLLPEHFIPRALRDMFDDAGATLNVRFELQNAAAQYPLISRGLAFGVLSPLSAWLYWATSPEPGAIRFLPIRPTIKYQFSILTPSRRPLSRLARAFAEMIRNEFNELLGDKHDDLDALLARLSTIDANRI